LNHEELLPSSKLKVDVRLGRKRVVGYDLAVVEKDYPKITPAFGPKA
jgi:hypothetical protein